MHDPSATLDCPARSAEPPLEAVPGLPQDLLDALPVAVCICSADGRMERCNRRAVDLWGLPDAAGRQTVDACLAGRIFRPDGAPVPAESSPLALALRRGISTRDEAFLIERPNGSRVLATLDIAPVRGNDGRIAGLLICAQEVRALPPADQIELEDFLENGVAGFHVLSGDGTILHANRAELDLLGYAASDYIGRPVRDFHVDAGEAEQILDRLSRGEQVRNRTVRLRARDGSVRHAILSASPLFRDGRHISSRALSIDVTEAARTLQLLRENEQRLAATYENAGIGIGETDADGRLLRVNEAYCAITGRSREQLLGTSFSDFTPEEDRAEELALHADLAAGARDSYALEKRLLRADGSLRWVSVTASAVRGMDGRFLYGVRILQDISAQRLALERQQMLMGELNHRIKNTLATVQSLAYQTARKAPDAAGFYEKFQGRLMALGKAHSLLTRSHWSGAALRDIIEEQVLPYREGEGRRIILTGQAVALTADQAVVLGMVFHELVTNAIKHGCLSWPSGKVRVNWQVVDDPDTGQPWLHLVWQESGGPPAGTPLVHGFGSVFIERSIRDQLGGSIRMMFLPTGLNCRLEIPLSVNKERPA